MSHLIGIDVSRWQGIINWPAVPHHIAIVKMSGGDDGLYIDSKANANYYGAQAAGKAIGMYHFAGGTDPIAEADYFINACSPLAENDVLVLDWEVQHPDPVGWCTAFVNRVHDRTGVWPLIYFNGSTWNSRDWSPVTKNCGVWVAWYDRDPEADLPVGGKIYVMHQYTSSGSVPGIAGNVDMNAWFGTLDQFKKYGYHNAAPITPPTPTPTPVEPPVIAPPIAPTPVPVPTPEPQPEPTPEPVPEPTPPPTEPTPPPEPSQPSIEAIKVVGRNGVLAALSSLITAFSNWLLLQIIGLHLPTELLVSIGALVYATLLAVDKWIHNSLKTKLKGIVPF